MQLTGASVRSTSPADRIKGFAVPHPAPITLLLLAGAALLAFAALHDLGFRTVPNRISLALLALGIVVRLLQHDLPLGLGCGAAVFAATYFFWFMGWMGGADVKLLGSAAVVVAPVMVPTLVIGTSLAGGVLALLYLLGSRLVPQPRPALAGGFGAGLVRRAARCELRRLQRRGPLPYAAAIAAGGWLAIAGS